MDGVFAIIGFMLVESTIPIFAIWEIWQEVKGHR